MGNLQKVISRWQKAMLILIILILIMRFLYIGLFKTLKGTFTIGLCSATPLSSKTAQSYIKV